MKRFRPNRSAGNRLDGVYVLDLDRTIVGDTTALLQKMGVAALAQRLGLLTDGAAAIHPWAVDAVGALIRPHFAEFMAAAHRQGVHVFVYTHGTADYADFVVRAVEEVIGQRFQRPVFSRDRSATPGGGKAMSIVSSAIERALGGGPPLAARAVTIVDDDDTVWAQPDRQRYSFVRCPSYAYVAFVDPFDGFPPAVCRHPEIARYASENGLYNPAAGPAVRYRWCESRLRDVERDNQWLRRDAFWKHFLESPPLKRPPIQPKKDESDKLSSEYSP